MNEIEITSGRINPHVDPHLTIWGWEIPVYLFIGGLVAGILFFSAFFHIRGKKDTLPTAVLKAPLFALPFLGIGMFVHVMLDTLYLSYVQLFWPFSAQKINFAIVPVIALSEIQLRLLQVTDFYTDIFFFYIPILIIAFKKNLHKKIRIPFLIYILVDFAVITFFMFNAFTSPVDYNQFVINLYKPGVFFLLISVFSPFLFKEVINDFKFKTRDIVIISSLFVFSQFLFWLATFH